MALMVIDHALFYFTDPAILPGEFFDERSRNLLPSLFWMGWVSHFCAPTFFLLAGFSAYLQQWRGMTKASLAKYLLSRGLLLIALDFTVVQWCLFFSFNSSVFSPIVLWILGVSMIVLAGLIWLPTYVIGGLSVAVISLHNLLDRVTAADGGAFDSIWTLLHREGGGGLILPGERVVFVNFTLIPWFALLTLGYAIGPLLVGREPSHRKRLLWGLGGVMTAAFFVLRFCNVYGDPHPWPHLPGEFADDPLWRIISFFNAVKFPASLQFVLMTLGPVFLLWGCLDGERGANGPLSWRDRLLRPLEQFGRVPLFFYIGQWFVLHVLALILAWCEGRPTDWLFATFDLTTQPFRVRNWDAAADIGWEGALGASVIAILILYPACLWYGGLKRRYPHSLLRFL